MPLWNIQRVCRLKGVKKRCWPKDKGSKRMSNASVMHNTSIETVFEMKRNFAEFLFFYHRTMEEDETLIIKDQFQRPISKPTKSQSQCVDQGHKCRCIFNGASWFLRLFSHSLRPAGKYLVSRRSPQEMRSTMDEAAGTKGGRSHWRIVKGKL